MLLFPYVKITAQKMKKTLASIILLAGLFVLSGCTVNKAKEQEQQNNIGTVVNEEKDAVQQTEPYDFLTLQGEMKNGWKIFRNEKISISVPANWEKEFEKSNILHSSENSDYQLNVLFKNINQIKDGEIKLLVEQGRMKEYKEVSLESMCKETGSCGKLINFQEISLGDINGAEFKILYSGIAIDEPRGSRIETRQTFIKGDSIYEFWTSEKKVPADLLERYPDLDPSPSELFGDIMSTLEIK